MKEKSKAGFTESHASQLLRHALLISIIQLDHMVEPSDVGSE